MRKIEKIIVHCSAGSQHNTADDIVRYHTTPTSKGGCGWKNPGYHFIVEASGRIVETLPVEKVSNGCKGHNSTAINVCYIGGVKLPSRKAIDNRTEMQKTALRYLLTELREKFHNAKIHSHRDFANKYCPSFDATSEYSDI